MMDIFMRSIHKAQYIRSFDGTRCLNGFKRFAQKVVVRDYS